MKQKINYMYIIIPIIVVIVGLIIFIVFINKPKTSDKDDKTVKIEGEDNDTDILTLDTPQEQILYDRMSSMFLSAQLKSDTDLKEYFKNDFIKVIKCISKSLGSDIIKVPDDFNMNVQQKIAQEILPNCKVGLYMIIVIYNLGGSSSGSECKIISEKTIKYIKENFPNVKITVKEYIEKYMTNPSFVEKINKIYETCKPTIQEQIIYDKMLGTYIMSGKITKQLFLDNFSFHLENYVKCINEQFLSRGVNDINNIEQLEPDGIYFLQLTDISSKCPVSQILLILSLLIMEDKCKKIDRNTLLNMFTKYDVYIKFTPLEFRSKLEQPEFINEIENLATVFCDNS
jgi:hypothetical protein